MKLLEINHVEKSFDDLNVLKDISLSVEDGEIVSIIGPSGSGKSTLLRCATMLETMDSGEIVYLGKKAVWSDENGKLNYADKKDLKEIQSQYGLVFQNFNLFPHFSVLKNITDAPIHVQKRDKEEVYKEARELLKKMGLEDKENAYPCQLSGGQCQRVAIARALALKPKILFFDEPTSALDPELTGEVLKVIKSLADLHIAMVIVTHEVFQNFNLFPHFSVLKNITDAPIHVQKRDKEEVYKEARELLKKMGLEDKENAYPCQLSGGQCQRVAIARALALKPKILFFDEPTSALDPELTGEVLKVIKSLADLHIAMVIVTHEMAFARDISHRVIFMAGGVIVEEGAPEKVFASDNERTRSFLGRYGNLL